MLTETAAHCHVVCRVQANNKSNHLKIRVDEVFDMRPALGILVHASLLVEDHQYPCILRACDDINSLYVDMVSGECADLLCERFGLDQACPMETVIYRLHTYMQSNHRMLNLMHAVQEVIIEQKAKVLNITADITDCDIYDNRVYITAEIAISGNVQEVSITADMKQNMESAEYSVSRQWSDNERQSKSLLRSAGIGSVCEDYGEDTECPFYQETLTDLLDEAGVLKRIAEHGYRYVAEQAIQLSLFDFYTEHFHPILISYR